MKYGLIVIACLFVHDAWSQAENAERRRNFNHDNGVAMKDFDPVSYFKGKPLKGDSKYTYSYKSIKYWFASDQNMEEFKKSPGKYEPAYGGWCAYSMAIDGSRKKVDPATYKIINGKLYLFSNFNGNNSLLKWDKNEKKLKDSADRNWVSKMN